MPAAYEAMRDKFAKGAPRGSKRFKRAQSKAAAIYNSSHPDNPVTGKHRKGIKGKHIMAALGGK